MVPSIAKFIYDSSQNLEKMPNDRLKSIVDAGENTLPEIKNISELLMSLAVVLGDDENKTSIPSDDQLSSMLFSVAHSLESIEAMLDLAGQAEHEISKRKKQA